MWIKQQRIEKTRKFTESRKTKRKNNFALIISIDDSITKGREDERREKTFPSS